MSLSCTLLQLFDRIGVVLLDAMDGFHGLVVGRHDDLNGLKNMRFDDEVATI
jgi:hypothetical protein